MTINTLPDLVLLEIFDCYLFRAQRFAESYSQEVRAWHTLVHVCRNWRAITFASPRRLNLRLFCTNETRVRETLAVWPRLPIIVWQPINRMWGLNNIIEALEYNNRVCGITLHVPLASPQSENVLAAMQQPFPALTSLNIQFQDGETDAIVPDSFLGGSAQSLRSLDFYRVPFPGLPRLLLSATDLVHLVLWKIPHSGYFSSEAMVRCLSALTKLEDLWLEFETSPSRLHQNNRRPTPPVCIVLPALTSFTFTGASEYLEDLVGQIDAPLLDRLEVTFDNLTFNTPQFVQFIRRRPNVKAPDEAFVLFSFESVRVSLYRAFPGRLSLGVLCSDANSQLSSLAKVCSSSFPSGFIRTVKHLYVGEAQHAEPDWHDGIENRQWREALDPFIAVENLTLSRGIVLRILPALQESVGERVIEVIPSLQRLVLEGRASRRVLEAIWNFITAQRLANHPIVLSRPNIEQDEGLNIDSDDSSMVDDASVPDDSSVGDD